MLAHAARRFMSTDRATLRAVFKSGAVTNTATVFRVRVISIMFQVLRIGSLLRPIRNFAPHWMRLRANLALIFLPQFLHKLIHIASIHQVDGRAPKATAGKPRAKAAL